MTFNGAEYLQCLRNRNLGVEYFNEANYSMALECQNKALEIAERMGYDREKIGCHANIGNIYNELGNFQEALKHHTKALEIAKRVGNESDQSRCHTNLGNTYFNVGELDAAIKHHNIALEVKIRIQDIEGQLKSYTGIGSAYSQLGDYKRAIQHHTKALEIAERIGNLDYCGRCHTNLGVDHFSLGDYKRAIQHHTKALEIAKRVGNVTSQSKCYTNLGNAYDRLGDYQRAIQHHTKALEIAERIGNPAVQLTCLESLGVAYDRLGDYQEAIEHYTKALEIAERIGDKHAESACLTDVGSSYYRNGDYNRSIQHYTKALEIAERIGDKALQSTIYLNLGLDYFELTDYNAAYTNFKSCIDLSEHMGVNIVQEESKIAFYGQSTTAYKYMIETCIHLKKEEEAYEYVERSKAKALRDILRFSKIRHISKDRRLERLVDQEEQLLLNLRKIQLNHLERRSSKGSDITAISELDKIDIIENRLNDIYQTMDKIDPEYVSIRKSDAFIITPKELGELLQRNDRNSALIEYYMTDNKMHIFLVCAQGIHIRTVDFSQAELLRYLDYYYHEIAKLHVEEKGKNSFRWLELEKFLIKPIYKQLSGIEQIYFVPHNLLHYLPIHALELNGEPLIKNYPIAYLPNASILHFLMKKGSGKVNSCASFGIDFPWEADAIAEIFNTRPLLDATKDIVSKNISDKDILHFSCHGFFDKEDPLSSGLLLYDKNYPSTRDILTAREIFNLKLNAELVTLSACETGINKEKPGDELIGLTRSFLYAGASSIVVSLWSVNAPPTQKLMVEFYRHLKEKGKDSKATALQLAQIKIMETRGWEHPHYWAPFILIGD